MVVCTSVKLLKVAESKLKSGCGNSGSRRHTQWRHQSFSRCGANVGVDEDLGGDTGSSLKTKLFADDDELLCSELLAIAIIARDDRSSRRLFPALRDVTSLLKYSLPLPLPLPLPLDSSRRERLRSVERGVADVDDEMFDCRVVTSWWDETVTSWWRCDDVTDDVVERRRAPDKDKAGFWTAIICPPLAERTCKKIFKHYFSTNFLATLEWKVQKLTKYFYYTLTWLEWLKTLLYSSISLNLQLFMNFQNVW